MQIHMINIYTYVGTPGDSDCIWMHHFLYVLHAFGANKTRFIMRTCFKTNNMIIILKITYKVR